MHDARHASHGSLSGCRGTGAANRASRASWWMGELRPAIGLAEQVRGWAVPTVGRTCPIVGRSMQQGSGLRRKVTPTLKMGVRFRERKVHAKGGDRRAHRNSCSCKSYPESITCDCSAPGELRSEVTSLRYEMHREIWAFAQCQAAVWKHKPLFLHEYSTRHFPHSFHYLLQSCK